VLDAATAPASLLCISPPGSAALPLDRASIARLVAGSLAEGPPIAILEPEQHRLLHEALGMAPPDRLDARILSAHEAERRRRVDHLETRAWSGMEARNRHLHEADGVRVLVGSTSSEQVQFAPRWLRQGVEIGTNPGVSLPIGPGLAVVVDDPGLRVGWARDRVEDTPNLPAVLQVLDEAVAAFVSTHGDTTQRLAFLTTRLKLDLRKRTWVSDGTYAVDEARLTEPLLPSLSGPLVSFAELADSARAHQRLAFVGATPDPEDPLDLPGGRLVVCLEERQRWLLATRMPLDDVAEEVGALRRRAVLAAAGPPQAARLPASAHATRQFALDHPALGRVTGEIALAGPNRVLVLFRGQEATRLTDPLDWSVLNAVVNVTELSLDGKDVVPESARSAIQAILAGEAEAQLAERLRGKQASAQSRSVFRWLMGDASRTSRIRTALEKRDHRMEPMLAAAVFGSTEGAPFSLRDLTRRALKHGRLLYLPTGVTIPQKAGRLPRLSPQQSAGIARYIEAPRVDLSAERRRETDRQRALAAMPLLRTAPPTDALAHRRVNSLHGGVRVTGLLWIKGPGADQALLRSGVVDVGFKDRSVSVLQFPEIAFALRGHLTSPDLKLTGQKPLHDDAYQALILAAVPAARRLVLDAARTTHPTTEARNAVQALVLQQGLTAYRTATHGTASLTGPLFMAPVFPRADGEGHIGLRTILADYEADGEVGYLTEAVTDPDWIEQDLAVVVTHPAVHRGFGQLLGDGWVDYGPKVASAPAKSTPATRIAEPAGGVPRVQFRIYNHLSKLARTLDDDEARRLLIGIQNDVCPGGSQWLRLVHGGVLINADHPRTHALEASLTAAQPVSAALAGAVAGAVLSGRNLHLVLGALARSISAQAISAQEPASARPSPP
ncbi:MAG: hypothetical protein ACI9WU_004521, partial [Myxococcota bacterium]